jgi:DNA-binding response OmpR family regulator
MPAATTRPLPRILVVHHDASTVRFLREMFIWHRCAALIEQSPSAESARQRLAAAGAAQDPQLILIGLGLHHQDGLGLLRHLRHGHRLAVIPVVVLAEAARTVDESRALALGADLYLEVPTGVDDFDLLVRRCRELLALGDDVEEPQAAG